MTVTIEDAEFDLAVKELAAVTGEAESVALKVSVQERLDRLTHRSVDLNGTPNRSIDDRQAQNEVGTGDERPTVEELMALMRSFQLGPVDYRLSEDEILGYGSNGYCE